MPGRMILVSAFLLSASIYMLSATTVEPEPIRQSLNRMPLEVGSWLGQRDASFDEDVLTALGADDYLSRDYHRYDGASIDLYIGYYQSQRHGGTMHSPLNCLPGAGWNPVRKGDLEITVSEGRANDSTSAGSRHLIKVNRIIIQKGLKEQVVLYWYQSHGRVIANEYWAKIFTVIDAIRIKRTDAAMVRVTCPIDGRETRGETVAQAQATDFVCELFPWLDRFLPN
jgi:EpsI family protein